jgi:hypothetical protein
MVARCRDYRLARPITQEMIDRLRPLTAQCMVEDPRWRWAPIGTPGNHKRDVLTLPVALEYAKAHSVCVVLYRHPIQGAVAITGVEREVIYANEINAGMWGVFVPGAPAHLAQNISTARRAANSSPVVMHSITFPPEISLEEANEYRNRIGNAAAGEVVRLPFLPHSINVTVEGMNPAQWRADQRKYYDDSKGLEAHEKRHHPRPPSQDSEREA